MERQTRSAIWLGALITTLTLAWIAPTFAEPPTRRALLIGIDEYQAVTDLRGAVNDVELIKDILIGKFDVPVENISTLTDAQATRVNIIQAIEENLIAPAREGDVVILHYSGHGSQMRDQPDGDEVDGWDETIVPHDSRTNGVFDISDDEINGLLHLLTQKTKNVTFILDSCHSGAAARAGNRVRKIARDTRNPPASPDYAISARGGEGDAGIRLNGSDYVLISGCLAPELSNETRFGDRRHGAMTWFLAEALRAAQPGATYRSVMDSVRTNVTSRFPTQHPQVEGPGVDLNIFGVDRINSAPYVLVQSTDDGALSLDGGKLMGLRANGEYSVYPPGTTSPDASGMDGVLRIIALEDFSAQAELVSGIMPTTSARVFIGPTTFNQLPTTVFVNPELPTAAGISTALTSLPVVELVPTPDDAQLIIEPESRGITIRTGDLSLTSQPIDSSAANFQDRVIEQVQDIVHWRALRDLQNPNATLQVSFDLAVKDSSPARLNPNTAAPGQRLFYRVQNREQDVPLYNYVLDVSSDGSVALLYPPPGEQQALAPGATLKREIEMFLPPGAPAVTDVLKVISTTSPIDPSVFPQGALRSAPMPAGARATNDPLSLFLANAMRGRRGAKTVSDATWTTRQREVIVRHAQASLSGFTLHFSDTSAPETLPSAIGATRDICEGDEPSPQTGCMGLRMLDADGSLVELIAQRQSRADEAYRSVGAIFDEAYAIQEQTGADRVEPVLESEAPGLTDNRGIDKRELLGDDGHDPLAESDDRWSLKMIQVEPAWQKIRDRHQSQAGQEARGIRIAHTDTGYLPHPENWVEVDGIRPIDPDSGHDYFDNDDDPVDPLIQNSKLDNPGHGTASGSVIVSPPGCQLEGTQGCVNGVAPGAQLIPLRVNKTVSQFDTRNLANAIRDVARGNIPGEPSLISTAMGGPPTFNLYRAVKERNRAAY